VEYRIFEREIAVGWPQPKGRLCTHRYLGKWGVGADLGTRPVVVVDYDVFQNKVEIITINQYKHRHGG